VRAVAESLVDREEIAARAGASPGGTSRTAEPGRRGRFRPPVERNTVDQRAVYCSIWCFGFMVVARLLPLVRALGRLPAPVSRSYAWPLDAVTDTVPCDQLPRIMCGGQGYTTGRAWPASVTASSPGSNAARRRTGEELQARHALSIRWDPYFADYMTLEAVYRYPTKPSTFTDVN